MSVKDILWIFIFTKMKIYERAFLFFR